MENKIIFYQNQDSNVVINVTYFEDNFWLTQRLIAQLFGVEVPAINKHLNNIFEENELDKEATISKMEIVQQEGNRQVKRQVEFYNLDAIIAVGYRVNSKQATQFRIWATKTLKEYIIKGFVLNDEMLKNGKPFGKDYFNEFVKFEPANAVFFRSWAIFSNNAVPITARMPRKQSCFTKWFKTNGTLPLREIPPQKSSITVPTETRILWDYRLGKMLRTAKS